MPTIPSTPSPPVLAWHIVIGGFLQHEGQPVGMVRLWRELYGLHASPETVVALRSWDDSMSNLAEMMYRHRPHSGESAQVKIYGYSWGGASAINLCRRLDELGFSVERLLLCDAVYRSWVPIMRFFRAFCPHRKLRVPENVRRVEWFFQRVDWPRGHRVTANQEMTESTGTELHLPHCNMDESSAFHEAAYAAARGEP